MKFEQDKVWVIEKFEGNFKNRKIKNGIDLKLSSLGPGPSPISISKLKKKDQS